jgi:hypothetical protein
MDRFPLAPEHFRGERGGAAGWTELLAEPEDSRKSR